MEFLNGGVIVLGLHIHTLILQLVDLDLAQSHDVDIFVGIRQVGKSSTDGNCCGQC